MNDNRFDARSNDAPVSGNSASTKKSAREEHGHGDGETITSVQLSNVNAFRGRSWTERFRR
jgi:hypothetical protein